LSISNQQQHGAALAIVDRLKTEKAAFVADFNKEHGEKWTINQVRNVLLAHEKRIVEAYDSAITTAYAKCRDYERAAKEAADRERKRLEQAELDRQRRENEAEAKRLADLARKSKDADAKQELARQAEAARTAPVVAVAVQVEAAVATSDTLTDRDNWSAEVFDEAALWKAARTNPVLKPCYEVCMKYLNATARNMKGAMNTLDDTGALPFPGVRAVNNPTPAKVGGRK
jgi:hypothetical protein